MDLEFAKPLYQERGKQKTFTLAQEKALEVLPQERFFNAGRS